MLKIVSLPTTNQITDKDWARATKDLNISACIGSESIQAIESKECFTRQNFEDALKKTSRKISKV